METLADPNAAKRKRSPSDVLPPARPAPSTPSAASPHIAGQINYLTRQKSEKLKLIEGDDDTFSGVLQLLDEYDGVLQRRESLAGNLGANLVGPLLLNAFENYFTGPIYLIGTANGAPPGTVAWADIVNFAQECPNDFVLKDGAANPDNPDPSGPQAKVCRFWLKNNHIQISENDWRLILSGIPQKMLPQQLNPEDENVEMVTLDILEGRLSALIKKADAVATRTRQLNYQLKNRKNAIIARRPPVPISDQQGNNSGEWGQQSMNSSHNTMAPNPQDLLRQFSLFQEPSTPSSASRNQGNSSKKVKPSASSGNLNNPGSASNPSFTSINQANNPRGTSSPVPRQRNNSKALLEDPPYRALMVSYIEKLNRGDTIWPPCDRCRRLKMACIKNYTACLGCTKKHCKCFFRDVGSEEVMIAGLEADSEIDGTSEMADKKREGSQKINEGSNEKPNESGFGQENRDVEMGGIPGVDAGISTPSSANNGSRSYYESTAALFSDMGKPSPNGTTAPTGYPSGNPNTMTATMTVPATGISGGHSSGSGGNHGGYGIENTNYQVSGNPGPQQASPSVQEGYAHQHPHSSIPTRNASTQGQDVNYIRPIAGEPVLRDVYSMPSEQPGDEWKSNTQRDMAEPTAAFFAEMQRHAEGNASNNAAVPDNSGTAPSA